MPALPAPSSEKLESMGAEINGGTGGTGIEKSLVFQPPEVEKNIEKSRIISH